MLIIELPEWVNVALAAEVEKSGEIGAVAGHVENVVLD